MSLERNTAAIVSLAAEKSEQARQRTREAIHRLQEQGKPINFTTVSRAAHVSKTFLYDVRHADLAQEIRRLHGLPPQSPAVSHVPHRKSEGAKDAQIARLKERVYRLEQQVRTLQQENELLYGKLATRSGH